MIWIHSRENWICKIQSRKKLSGSENVKRSSPNFAPFSIEFFESALRERHLLRKLDWKVCLIAQEVVLFPKCEQ